MMSDRTRPYLLPALLAAPPVVMIGFLCNSLLPSPQTVPAVVAANDPGVNTAPFVKTGATRRTIFQIAGRAN